MTTFEATVRHFTGVNRGTAKVQTVGIAAEILPRKATITFSESFDLLYVFKIEEQISLVTGEGLTQRAVVKAIFSEHLVVEITG
jgi:hypothetical protein